MITLKDLSYAYPGQKESSALKDVSLHIESGECVVLCGRSGCGKTTLLRTVNGLIPHFHGGTVTGRKQWLPTWISVGYLYLRLPF